MIDEKSRDLLKALLEENEFRCSQNVENAMSIFCYLNDIDEGKFKAKYDLLRNKLYGKTWDTFKDGEFAETASLFIELLFI